MQNVEHASIAKIDCTVYRLIYQDFEVKGYPTLLWVEDGKKIEKYSGSRGHDELHSYVKKILGNNAIQDATTTEKPVSDQDKLLLLQLTGDNFDKTLSARLQKNVVEVGS